MTSLQPPLDRAQHLNQKGGPVRKGLTVFAVATSMFIVVAGPASADVVGVNTTGPASGDFLAISGTGSATGQYAISGTGNAYVSQPTGYAVSGTGDASGYNAVSGLGSATGTNAYSGLGDATGTNLGVSALGNASGTGGGAVGGAGNASGQFIGVTTLGNAAGNWAVSGFGNATGSQIAIAPFGNANAGIVEIGCYGPATPGVTYVFWCAATDPATSAEDAAATDDDWATWVASGGSNLLATQVLQVPVGQTFASSGCVGHTGQQTYSAGYVYGGGSTTCSRFFKRAAVDSEMERDRWYGQQELDREYDVEPNTNVVSVGTQYHCAGDGRYTYTNYTEHEVIDYDNTHYVAGTVNKNRITC